MVELCVSTAKGAAREIYYILLLEKSSQRYRELPSTIYGKKRPLYSYQRYHPPSTDLKSKGLSKNQDGFEMVEVIN